MEPDDLDDLDDSFNASSTPAGAAPEGVESLIAKMSEFVQRCNPPAGDVTELNEQLWSLQVQVKLLAANQGGSGTRGSRSASRRMSSEKKKKKKKAEVADSMMPVQLGLKSPGQLPPFAPGPGMIKMLIVEDDPFQADSIMLLCEQCGYKAQVCSNGTEALEVVRTDASINLVLSDVMMAGVSGYELLCEIRKIRNSVSVIMISAYESIDLVERCILSGADAYMLKPLRMHELRNIWQYVWRRRHEVLVRQHAREIGVAEGYTESESSAAVEGAALSAAQGPDLDAAQKVKGERQRLSNPDPPELQKMSRGLEKIEMETKKNLDKVCYTG